MARVLIVEDDAQVAGLYQDKLRMGGHDVDLARDGEEGFTKATSDTPDIVLLDLMMPGMDGLAMLKRLRADERGKSVPVIILTNAFEPEGLKEIEGLYSDYVMKVDLALDDLLEKVKMFTT